MKNIVRARLTVLLSQCTTARQIRAPPSLHCLATNVTGRYQLTTNTQAVRRQNLHDECLTFRTVIMGVTGHPCFVFPPANFHLATPFHSRLRVRHGQIDRLKYASVTERRMPLYTLLYCSILRGKVAKMFHISICNQ